MDPLTKSYPWYTPYQFAGNMPTLAIDLDGLEPQVEHGILVGYLLMPDQGPSQVAAHINDPRTQKEFGYTLIEPVTWDDIVNNNYDLFYSSVSSTDNIHDEGYSKNTVAKVGALLEVCAQCTTNPKSDQINTIIAGVDGSAGIVGGASGSAYFFKLPKDTPFWEFGQISIGGAEVSVSPSKKFGGEVGIANVGMIRVFESDNPSVKDIFSASSTTFTGGFISPVGVGGKGIYSTSDGYDYTIGSLTFGTPGPIGSVSSSEFGVGFFKNNGGPKSLLDSINRANAVLNIKKYSGSREMHNFLQQNDSLNYEYPVQGGY